ncbi:MAG TPA: transposase [Dehalococcoidia bacterium]|nr:transposase [Dehalococcoidia bacterium]
MGGGPQGPPTAWGLKGADLHHRRPSRPGGAAKEGLSRGPLAALRPASRAGCAGQVSEGGPGGVGPEPQAGLPRGNEAEAREALQKLRQRWGRRYARTVARWKAGADALLAFLRHPKAIRQYLYTTDQLERLAKGVNRRAKVVEAFCGEEAVEKLLYLVFQSPGRGMGDEEASRICEIVAESYHPGRTQ